MSNSKMLDSILVYAIQKKVSDVHITSGKSITYRIKKKLVKMEQAGIIDDIKIKTILLELMN
jgi:Tfp pilus assembly pilus retraction ATPase PilT